MVSHDFYILAVIPVGMPNWVKQRRVFADCPALNRERYRAAEIAEQHFKCQAEEAGFRGDLEAKEEAEVSPSLYTCWHWVNCLFLTGIAALCGPNEAGLALGTRMLQRTNGWCFSSARNRQRESRQGQLGVHVSH